MKEATETKVKTKYRELLGLFRSLRKEQAILLMICFISIISNLYFTYLVQDVVDLFIVNHDVTKMKQCLGSMLFWGIFAFIIGVVETKRWHMFRYKIINWMRTLMHKKMLSKDANFFNGKTTGDVVSSIMDDGAVIAEQAGIGSLMIILNILQIVIILAVLILKNMFLGLVVVACGIMYYFFINSIKKKMRPAYTKYSQENANLRQRVIENNRAVLDIKSLNEKDFFQRNFEYNISECYMPAASKIIKLDVMNYSVNEFIQILFPVFVLVVGGILVSANLLTVGSVILFYVYTQKLVEPLNNLSDAMKGAQMAIGYADRVYDFLFDEEKDEKEEFLCKNELVVNIDIENFGWKEDQIILKDIEEEFVPGDIVFVQGESGKGKSSLLKLAAGFYDIAKGKVSINDKNIRDIREEDRYSYIKFLPQEPIILEGSIRSNLELGQKYTDDEINNALKMAMLKEFVAENGLEYRILENGKNLSGGQKQRLALARVLLRKPVILFLDEATSALDEKNEIQIIRNLYQYVKENKSILFVTSHRKNLGEICNKEIRV